MEHKFESQFCVLFVWHGLLQYHPVHVFEVIPAPVYARGFLRSYSQYLGLDPAEALAMFPREDDPEYQRAADANSPPARASRETPVSPVSAARPTWRAPVAEQQQPLPHSQRSGPAPYLANQPAPIGRSRREPKPAPANPPDWEPVIGIDIGVPSPAHRIKVDPAAQTRSVVVAIVALGVIVGAILVAILISNLGNAETPPGTGVESTRSAGSGLATSTAIGGASGSAATPGIVPTLIGLGEAAARQKVAEAGYLIDERRVKNSAEKGSVIDQSPAPGIELNTGQKVVIVISDGP